MKTKWLFVFLIVFMPKVGFPQLISLSKLQEIHISEGFSFLADSTQSLQLKNLIGEKHQSIFQPVNEKAWKTDVGVYWLSFLVKNETNFDQEWIFDFENWSFVDFYYSQSGFFNHKKTGHSLLQKKRLPSCQQKLH